MSWSSTIPEHRNMLGNLFASRGQGKVRVTFNGVDVSKECRYASEEEGMVICYRRNKDDSFYVDPDRPDQAAQQTLYGIVKIEVLP